MKIFILLFILFLFSCSNNSEWMYSGKVENMQDISAIMKSIVYENDITDNWKLPESTYYSKAGDCEDTAGLLAHLMIHNLNYTDVMMVGCINTKTDIPHMLVYHDGKYYEGQTGEQTPNNYKIIFEFKFSTYITLARIK